MKQEINNIDKVLKKANFLIEKLNENFSITQTFNAERNARIDGILECLSILTGDQYCFNEHGVYIKK